MTVLKTKTISSNLQKKGFSEYENDHTRLILWVNGKKTGYRTKISHGMKEIDDSLISQMAKQIGLSANDFVEFAKCNISEEEYLKIIKYR